MNGKNIIELWFGTTLIIQSPQIFAFEIRVIFQSSFTGASAIKELKL